jgi:large subunit ribosomal protein L28
MRDPKHGTVKDKNTCIPYKRCQLTGAYRNLKRTYSFSMRSQTKPQKVNLQTKRLYWPEKDCMVKMIISTRALRTIRKLGLENAAKKYNVDLTKYQIKKGPTNEYVKALNKFMMDARTDTRTPEEIAAAEGEFSAAFQAEEDEEALEAEWDYLYAEKDGWDQVNFEKWDREIEEEQAALRGEGPVEFDDEEAKKFAEPLVPEGDSDAGI